MKSDVDCIVVCQVEILGGCTYSAQRQRLNISTRKGGEVCNTYCMIIVFTLHTKAKKYACIDCNRFSSFVSTFSKMDKKHVATSK